MINLILNNGWYYTIENSEVTIHGRTGDEMELIIPQFIEGFPVKHIKKRAFEYDDHQSSKITTLKLPEGLLSIGFNAFFDHHIRDLEIPDSVTSIENDAFYHFCEDLFHTIKIPSNVELGRDAICEGFIEYYNLCGKQAGTYILEGCWYKKGDNDTWSYYIENGCAVITGYHGNETEVTIPSRINNIPVSTVSGPYRGFGVFEYVKQEINTVIISEGITRIERNTFIGLPYNKISKVIFPKSLTWIGANAFKDNKITSIIIPDNMEYDIKFDIEYERHGKKAGNYKYSNGRWLFINADGEEIKIEKPAQTETKEEKKPRDNIFKDLNFGQAVLASCITVAAIIASPFIGAHMLIKVMKNESKKRNKNKFNTVQPEPVPPQIAVNPNTVAAIFEDHVDIFGLSLPLDKGRFGGTGYHRPAGELESFRIGEIIIKLNEQEIPITSRMVLYRDGSFHGAAIYKGVRYKHQNMEYVLSGGIFFYPSGKLKRFTTAEKIETNFIVNGEKLVLHKYETVYFYEDSGKPKTLIKRIWRDIDEDGNITGRFTEKSRVPDYD